MTTKTNNDAWRLELARLAVDWKRKTNAEKIAECKAALKIYSDNHSNRAAIERQIKTYEKLDL